MVLYDAPDCWKCVEVKESLDALGLEYEAVTVRGNPEARAALVALQGEPPLVPMLVDGGTPFREMPVYMGGVCTIGERGACG